MKRQSGLGCEDKTEFYARQWFASMAKFHRVNNPGTWEFTEEDLIAFLRYNLNEILGRSMHFGRRRQREFRRP